VLGKRKGKVLKLQQEEETESNEVGEIVDLVCDKDNLKNFGGMEHHAQLYLQANLYEPDTRAWLTRLIVKGKTIEEEMEVSDKKSKRRQPNKSSTLDITTTAITERYVMRYEVRWEDGIEIKTSEHDNEKDALYDVVRMSKDFRMAQMAEFEGDQIKRQLTYEHGKLTSERVGDKDIVIPKVAEAEANADVAKASSTKGRQKTAKAAPARSKAKELEPALPKTEEGKETKSSAKVKTKPASKKEAISETATDVAIDEDVVKMSPRSAKIYGSFEYRKGSGKDKVAKYLASNFGKQVTLNQVGRAAYGTKWKEDKKSALNMALRGVSMRLKKRKIPAQLKREKNDKKEVTVGFHSK
jgi:hypothetical protein